MPFARFGAASTYTGPAGGPGSAGVATQSQTNAGAIGPAATVTFVTTNIVSTKTGLFLIIADVSANCSGVSTQQGFLERDGGAGGPLDLAIAGTGGAGPFNCGFVFVIQLAALSTHTFQVRLVASAGTNTIPIGNAVIAVLEV